MARQADCKVLLFVSPVAEELTCPICLEVFNSPVMLECGHTFCKECFHVCMENKRECPLCKSPCSVDYAPRNNILIASMVDNLLIYCRFGISWNPTSQEWEQTTTNSNLSAVPYCKEVIPLSKKEDHEQNCPFRVVRCKYWTLGCEQQVRFVQLDEHHSQCPYLIADRYDKQKDVKIQRLQTQIEAQDQQITKLQEANKSLHLTLTQVVSFLQEQFPAFEVPNILDPKPILSKQSTELQNCTEISDVSLHDEPLEPVFYERISNVEENPLQVVDSLSHMGGIESLAMSDNFLISACWDGTVNLWNLTDLEHSGSLECGADVRDLFLRDSRYLYCGCSSGILSMWDIEQQHKLAETLIPSNSDVLSQVAIQNTLFASSVTSKIYQYETTSLESKGIIETDHTNWIFALDTCASYLISGSSDKTVRSWDIETSKHLFTLQGHSNQVRAIHSMNENLVVSGSYDKTAILWDIRSKDNIGTVKLNGAVYSLGSVGRLLFSGEEEGCFHVWDSRNLSEPVAEGRGHSEPIYDFQCQSSKLYTCSSDQYVNVWS